MLTVFAIAANDIANRQSIMRRFFNDLLSMNKFP